jgi:hypothetical protein
MEERRKMSDRRVNPPKQGLPTYYTRHLADRRKNNLPAARKHWTEVDINLISRCLTENLGS